MSNTRSAPGAQEAVLRDVQRQYYDLSHWAMSVGAIGCLQTLSTVPVIAGDSFDVDLKAVFRLSPLRKQLYLDCMVDLFAFYIPYRHIYGTTWIDFIKQGFDEAQTFSTDTMAAAASLQCCGWGATPAAVLPRWVTRGYMKIWNRYFKDPTDSAGDLAENYFTTLADGDERLVYGLPCCYPKRIWNTGIYSTLTTADYRFALSGGEVSVLDLTDLQGRLKSEMNREFFGVRYKDILEQSWNSTPDYNADERPELIMRSTCWMSGTDVNGTDATTLGNWIGKASTVASLKFPRKFFPEHGTLWFMALVRFPAVNYLEHHFLAEKGDPTYSQISGDPDLMGRKAPYDLQTSDVFVGGGAVSLGSIPYAQWYREHPSAIHPRYVVDAGHPFLDQLPGSRTAAVYYGTTTYDSAFDTLKLKHWNCQAHIEIDAKRFIPDPVKSIFAGTGVPGGA